MLKILIFFQIFLFGGAVHTVSELPVGSVVTLCDLLASCKLEY